MAYIKLFHVLFVILWMGTLLVLTRLLSSMPKEDLKLQAHLLRFIRRIYLFVDLPCMVLAITFGALLFIGKHLPFFKMGWFHMKMTFVAFLVIFDGVSGRLILKGGVRKGKKIFTPIFLHVLVGILLIGVLLSIYIVKPKEKSKQNNLAKIAQNSMISAFKNT